jgi:squalene-hopene/tetraprenyl-beta-curcumene cyclase
LILLQTYLNHDEPNLTEQAAATILSQQLPEGGWPLVPDGTADLSTSVQAYFALKISGLDPSDERLCRARRVIRQLGGADAADITTRFFLALFGQIDFDSCPIALPEWLLFTHDRATCLAPFVTIWSHRAVRDIDAGCGVRELFINKPSEWLKPSGSLVGSAAARPTRRSRKLTAIARSVLSTLFIRCERYGWTPLRRKALQQAESQLRQSIDGKRITQRTFAELIWHMIAIRTIGHGDNSPEFRTCNRQLRKLVSIDEDRNLLRPRLRNSRRADTIAALLSLGASGVAINDPAASAAAQWLRDAGRRGKSLSSTWDLASILHCINIAGDRREDPHDLLPPRIQVRLRRSNPILIRENRRSSHLSRTAAIITRRLLQKQNSEGGWGLTSSGESAPDITAFVLEALAGQRSDGSDGMASALDRAIHFLRGQQRADGSWHSTTGVRLVHGTSLAVRGLLSAGVSPDDSCVAAGINWLLVHQHQSGGWGETARTSEQNHDEFVPGPATASQTAWSLLALIAAGRANHAAVRRGIKFLLDTQNEDGHWNKPQFVLYDPFAGRWFNNELHAVTTLLLTLSRWVVVAAASKDQDREPVTLRLVTELAGN